MNRLVTSLIQLGFGAATGWLIYCCVVTELRDRKLDREYQQLVNDSTEVRS